MIIIYIGILTKKNEAILLLSYVCIHVTFCLFWFHLILWIASVLHHHSIHIHMRVFHSAEWYTLSISQLCLYWHSKLTHDILSRIMIKMSICSAVHSLVTFFLAIECYRTENYYIEIFKSTWDRTIWKEKRIAKIKGKARTLRKKLRMKQIVIQKLQKKVFSARIAATNIEHEKCIEWEQNDGGGGKANSKIVSHIVQH